MLVGKTSGLERCELRFTYSCEQSFELLERSTGKLVNSLSELILLYLRLRKRKTGLVPKVRRWVDCFSAKIMVRGQYICNLYRKKCHWECSGFCWLITAQVLCLCRPDTRKCVFSHHLQAFTDNTVSQFSTVFDVRHNGTWYRPEMVWDHRMKSAYVDWNRLSQVYNRRVAESTRLCPK